MLFAVVVLPSVLFVKETLPPRIWTTFMFGLIVAGDPRVVSDPTVLFEKVTSPVAVPDTLRPTMKEPLVVPVTVMEPFPVPLPTVFPDVVPTLTLPDETLMPVR